MQAYARGGQATAGWLGSAQHNGLARIGQGLAALREHDPPYVSSGPRYKIPSTLGSPVLFHAGAAAGTSRLTGCSRMNQWITAAKIPSPTEIHHMI